MKFYLYRYHTLCFVVLQYLILSCFTCFRTLQSLGPQGIQRLNITKMVLNITKMVLNITKMVPLI
jgi:hypothetical protein